MRPTPSPARLLDFPVTGGLALAALAVSAANWLGVNVELVFFDARALHGEPWRFAFCVLPHGDLFHLAFNLGWLWTFGTYVEEQAGSLRTAALYLFLAVTSMGAQYALSGPGIGLSGIGYGLFGLLWVLSRRSRRHADAMDPQTVRLFLIWFVICVVATVTGLWRVGNAAHGGGLVAGALVGLVVAEQGLKRAGAAAASAALLALVAAGAGPLRPLVSLGGEGVGQDSAYLAWRAQEDGDDLTAVALYHEALALDPRKAGWWLNLAIAELSLGRLDAAERAAAQLEALEPGSDRAAGLRRQLEQLER